MRDPARIDPFLQELGELWKKVPDQRFGQFMCNILGEISSKGDPFFPEDTEIMKRFKDISWLKEN